MKKQINLRTVHLKLSFNIKMDKYRLILNYTENDSNLTFCITGVFCDI